MMAVSTAAAQDPVDCKRPKDAFESYYCITIGLASIQERDKLACYREVAKHAAANQKLRARLQELEAQLEEKEAAE